jgi:hypothetical protein
MNLLFKIKMTALNIYYGMSVKHMADKLGAFLRQYHESLQQLV